MHARFLLCAVAAFALAACGGDKSSKKTTQPKPPDTKPVDKQPDKTPTVGAKAECQGYLDKLLTTKDAKEVFGKLMLSGCVNMSAGERACLAKADPKTFNKEGDKCAKLVLKRSSDDASGGGGAKP